MATVQKPHDKLFRALFSDLAEAEAFLRAYLPESLSSLLDWSTLVLLDKSFVDETMRESESDLLYQIQRKAGQVSDDNNEER
jgi:predicted transposase/invertase (TIGR01784 family)